MEDNRKDDPQLMSFWGHLENLRWALMRSAGVLLVCMIACFCFMPYLFDHFVLAPTNSDFPLYRWLSRLGEISSLFPDFSDDSFSVEIININVASQFMTHITTSFWFALVLMFPYLIFEIWHFVQPALFVNERKSVGMAFFFGTFMFFLGCFVGYFLVFPFTFRFLALYQVSPEVENAILLSSYIDTLTMLSLMLGITFEIPVLAWLFAKLSFLTSAFMRTYRKHAIIIALVISAIITPTSDAITLMLVAAPMFLLYEVSIFIVKRTNK